MFLKVIQCSQADTECIFCEIVVFKKHQQTAPAPAPASTNYALTLIDFNLIKTETFHFKHLFIPRQSWLLLHSINIFIFTGCDSQPLCCFHHL